MVRLKIQKMKVTNCPESEEISIDLQVGDHRSLELKSLNYTKVFFVESKWNFQFQQSPKTKVVWPQILVDSQKIQFHILLGFVVSPVLCKLFSPPIMIWHPLQHLLKSSNATSTTSPIFSRYWNLFQFLISLIFL